MAVMARNHEGHVLALFALARLGDDHGPDQSRVRREGSALRSAPRGSERVCRGDRPLDTRALGLRGAWHHAVVSCCSTAGGGRAEFLDEIERAADVEMPPPAGPDDTVSSSTPRHDGFPQGAMHSQRSFVTCGEAFVQRVFCRMSTA